MQSGRQTLASIDQALQQSQEDLQTVDQQIQTTGNALIALQEQQTERFKELAKIRLDQIISGGLAEGLDAAHRRVRELLDARMRSLDALERSIREARDGQQGLERRRGEIVDEVDEAAQALDAAEAAVQRQLEKVADYQAQLQEARSADRVADRAESKRDEARQNRAEKGKPYEDDPLFSYLWKRGYGTSRYSGNPLTRLLDRWVAGLCGYQDARPNYSMLLEIPERLRDHADSVRALADREFEALKAMEEQAARTGGVPPLREALEQAEQKLEEIDDSIRENEFQQSELLEKRTAFTAGEDEHFRQAVDTFGEAFERENLSALYRYADATPTAEDDIIVQELAESRDRADALKQTLDEHKHMRLRHLERVKELEEIRSRFKRERYDGAYSGFDNGALVGMILAQFLQGMASRDDLWRTIQREQRHRRVESSPDFGSGGFRRRKGTWRTPFPRTGGGFRTGGSF